MCTRNGCAVCRRLTGPQLTIAYQRITRNMFGPGDLEYLRRVEGCYEVPVIAAYRER
jgi:hypothetical protein